MSIKRLIEMFCPKCGSVLLPKKEGSKKVLICSCGYKSSNVEKTKLTEVLANKEKEVEVIEKGKLNILPIRKTRSTCRTLDARLVNMSTLINKSPPIEIPTTLR